MHPFRVNLENLFEQWFSAIASDDVERMGTLLEQDAGLLGVTHDSLHPLQYAAKHNSVAAISYLVSEGVNVNQPDADILRGKCALHFAVDAVEIEAAEALLHAGANPDAFDFRGRTPLLLAAMVWPPQTALISLLLRYGADARLPDQLSGSLPEEIAERGGHPEIAGLLRAARERLELGEIVPCGVSASQQGTQRL